MLGGSVVMEHSSALRDSREAGPVPWHCWQPCEWGTVMRHTPTANESHIVISQRGQCWGYSSKDRVHGHRWAESGPTPAANVIVCTYSTFSSLRSKKKMQPKCHRPLKGPHKPGDRLEGYSRILAWLSHQGSILPTPHAPLLKWLVKKWAV